jgi:hypothetical protein
MAIFLDKGDVQRLGESYIDGARRTRGVSTTWSIQEKEEEGLRVSADGGVLRLLVQIYTRTAGCGRDTLS